MQGNNGCTNGPQCCLIRTSPFFFNYNTGLRYRAYQLCVCTEYVVHWLADFLLLPRQSAMFCSNYIR